MFRFTIRDVLWLMALVAMGVGWWSSNRAVIARKEVTASHAVALRGQLKLAKTYSKTLEWAFQKRNSGHTGTLTFGLVEPDWSWIDKSIP
jgi:hypothetical protein